MQTIDTMSAEPDWLEGRARPPAEPLQTDIAFKPKLPARQRLGHEVPTWVSAQPAFFVTICCVERGMNQLTSQHVGHGLIESVRFLHERADWYARIFLVMPDHVQALISLPQDAKLVDRVSSWMGFTRKRFGIEWQSGFFDHRLRGGESLDEKASYIRLNPVRAGLIEDARLWPYVFDASTHDGSAGTPRPTS